MEEQPDERRYAFQSFGRCSRWPAGFACWRARSCRGLADRIAGLAIPALLAVAYTGLVLAFWSSAKGGFDSLDNVAALFQTRELLLAGWIHYLAFDLFVGAWIVRTARQAGVAFWLVVPCLALTFLFGPAGFLASLRSAPRAIRGLAIVTA